MNRYLVKIAEITSLPYRPRAEIVIVHPKTGKVLVTKNSRDGRTWKGLPGGGIESGDNVVDTAIKEALEEVGVAVTDAKEMGVRSIQHGYPSTKEGRNKKYGGMATEVVQAIYDGKDDSLYGDDGDSVKYVWMTPEDAHKEFKANQKLGGTHRIQAMEYLIRNKA